MYVASCPPCVVKFIRYGTMSGCNEHNPNTIVCEFKNVEFSWDVWDQLFGGRPSNPTDPRPRL